MNKQSLEMVSVRLRMPRYLKEIAQQKAAYYGTNMSHWIRMCIEWSEIEDQVGPAPESPNTHVTSKTI